MTDNLERPERLQVMLNEDEFAALDTWRFDKRMPSRAAAVRELLRRGLAAEGFLQARTGTRSADFGLLNGEDHQARPAESAGPTKTARAPRSQAE